MFNIDSIDNEAQAHGTWVDYSGSQFLIASINNFSFQREFNKLQRPHQRKIDKNTLDPKISLEILSKAMSNHILLDWKKVCDKAGAVVMYSPDRAYSVLMGNADLRSYVQEVAMDIENYKAEQEEDEGKSSQK